MIDKNNNNTENKSKALIQCDPILEKPVSGLPISVELNHTNTTKPMAGSSIVIPSKPMAGAFAPEGRAIFNYKPIELSATIREDNITNNTMCQISEPREINPNTTRDQIEAISPNKQCDYILKNDMDKANLEANKPKLPKASAVAGKNTIDNNSFSNLSSRSQLEPVPLDKVAKSIAKESNHKSIEENLYQDTLTKEVELEPEPLSQKVKQYLQKVVHAYYSNSPVTLSEQMRIAIYEIHEEEFEKVKVEIRQKLIDEKLHKKMFLQAKKKAIAEIAYLLYINTKYTAKEFKAYGIGEKAIDKLVASGAVEKFQDTRANTYKVVEVFDAIEGKHKRTKRSKQ